MTRNRLADETSPYLLQHKDNPVHWWAWGEEALAQARKTGKPILLSVGYSACHWCHVMAHESFEDEDTASVMNELFVNIKVDREERPDVDTIYMTALHSLGEQGGWPLTMFLTPEAAPFWGGTYFPKMPAHGRPGFIQLMREISRIYREEPEKVASNAEAITGTIAPRAGASATGEITEGLLADAASKIAGLVDAENGGLRGMNKFPQSPLFAFAWRAGLRYAQQPTLDAVLLTLRHICQGGIYDHLGGGFARYTVEARWLVPHFEKMLYDNAQLLDLLTEAWRETQEPLFKIRVEETISWLLREMTVQGGGFASSLDADSEGEEGKFYVWSSAEIETVLGEDDAAFFAAAYDVTPQGNWEGNTILNRLGALELRAEQDERRLAGFRAKLLEARASRVRPGFDDKVLADWNGLMITALARAGFIFDRDDWTDAAAAAYAFILRHMKTGNRLYHSWREGQAKAPASASDYANMISAALALFSVTGNSARLDDALAWAAILDEFYWSDELAGYTLAASDTTDIIQRPFSGHDDATPNPNGVMVSNLISLWLLSGEEAYRDRARSIIDGFTGEIAKNPYGHTSLLSGALDLIAPAHIVVAVPKGSDGAAPLANSLRRLSLPRATIQFVEDMAGLAPSSPAHGKTARDGKAAAYVCVGQTCAPPATDAEMFGETLKQRRSLR